MNAQVQRLIRAMYKRFGVPRKLLERVPLNFLKPDGLAYHVEEGHLCEGFRCAKIAGVDSF